MSPRVLVAYGSKYGSTAEIAERIGDTLRAAGLTVDVRRASEVGDLAGYRAIVLGSGVYARRWTRDARGLLGRLRAGERDVWLFSSGWIGKPPPNPTSLVSPRIHRAAKRLGAREHAIFGGRVPLEPSGFVARIMARATPEDQKDARDWGVIEDWAHGIAAELEKQRETTGSRS